MKILHISSARTLGGGERHLADLANALARRGHEIYAALVPSSPLHQRLGEIPSSNVLDIAPRNALDIVSARKLARLIREREIDIVHAHLARDYPPAAFAARRASHTRLVITRHVLFPLGKLHRLTLSNVARVIAVSEAVARALRAQAIFPGGKIRVVPNGIDAGPFTLPRADSDRTGYRRSLGASARFLVGMVGELSHVKGQDVFVRAAALVAREHDDVAFLIVGEDASREGETRARVESLIDELKLRDRLRLTGRLEDVAPLLASLDVFVSASRSEAFGLAIVEAMMSGVAVVATDTEGARELIDDGTTGLLVPSEDPHALAEAISSLLKNEDERTRIAARAREAARARFSLERMVAATEQVYREAIGAS